MPAFGWIAKLTSYAALLALVVVGIHGAALFTGRELVVALSTDGSVGQVTRSSRETTLAARVGDIVVEHEYLSEATVAKQARAGRSAATSPDGVQEIGHWVAVVAQDLGRLAWFSDEQIKPSAPSQRARRMLNRVPSKARDVRNPASDAPAVSHRPAAREPVFRTVCVRLCDGSFFPISFAATRQQLAADEKSCHARCGSPSKLFVFSGQELAPERMKDLAGMPYTRLSNAFKYRTEYNPACSCKSNGEIVAAHSSTSGARLVAGEVSGVGAAASGRSTGSTKSMIAGASAGPIVGVPPEANDEAISPSQGGQAGGRFDAPLPLKSVVHDATGSPVKIRTSGRGLPSPKVVVVATAPEPEAATLPMVQVAPAGMGIIVPNEVAGVADGPNGERGMSRSSVGDVGRKSASGTAVGAVQPKAVAVSSRRAGSTKAVVRTAGMGSARNRIVASADQGLHAPADWREALFRPY